MFLLSIAVMFIHDLLLHTFYIYYDVLYIYILINDISKDLSLYKVYLLCTLNMEDTWYFLLILWKKITLGWYLQHYKGVLFSFSKKIEIKYCLVYSGLFAVLPVTVLFLNVYWILGWACMLTKYVQHVNHLSSAFIIIP